MNPCKGPQGVGGSPHSSAAPTPGGRRDPTSGSVRQCANVTFGFMTLFLSSKCHGKCQTEAEDGEEPTKEGVRCWGWSGTNGGLWPGWDSGSLTSSQEPSWIAWPLRHVLTLSQPL